MRPSTVLAVVVVVLGIFAATLRRAPRHDGEAPPAGSASASVLESGTATDEDRLADRELLEAMRRLVESMPREPAERDPRRGDAEPPVREGLERAPRKRIWDEPQQFVVVALDTKAGVFILSGGAKDGLAVGDELDVTCDGGVATLVVDKVFANHASCVPKVGDRAAPSIGRSAVARVRPRPPQEPGRTPPK